MSVTSSCKGCEKRFVGCHATCEDYKSFKENLKMRNDIINKKKQTQVDVDGFYFRGLGKATHQGGKRRTGPH